MDTNKDLNEMSLAKYQDVGYGDSGYDSKSFGSSGTTFLTNETDEKVSELEDKLEGLNLERSHQSNEQENSDKITAYIRTAFTPDEDRDTYLTILLAKGSEIQARQLIEICPKPCYLDIQNHLGQAGIHVATYLNLYQLVHLLILKGVKIDLVDVNGENIFHICAKRGHIDTLKAIHDAVIKTGQQQMMMNLLHEADYNGYTPFYTAVSHKQPEICSILASLKINVNTTHQQSGNSPLHEAVIPQEADSRFVQFLIEHCELNVNHQNYRGVAPLHIASSKNDKLMCSVLLYHHADVNLRDINDYRPVDYTSDLEIREYLQP